MSTALHEPPVTDPGGLDAALDRLADALDEAGVELWQVPDRDLAAGAVRCGRLVSRTTALLTRLLGEVDTRELALCTGACSTTAWTRHELNLIPREARTLVGVATAVRGGMAVTGAAFAAGDVSLGQAAAITTTIGELPEDVPSEVRDRAESELVAYADRFDSAQLTRLGQHILTVVAPEIGEAHDAAALERQEQQARRRRELFFTPDGHGTVFVRGRLTDEAAAIIRAALDPLARPLPATADGPDPRTPGQRRADAMEELARRALTGYTDPPPAVADPGDVARGGDNGAATTVVVTIPLRTLTDGLGYATLPDGTLLSAGAARRKACDADLIPAVLGTGSAVLDVGRAQRLFTGARRCALILRDRGCAFPGCDRPASWCDGHHILGHAHGGSTAVDNGVLLCGHHHHVVHNDGWQIYIVDDGVPEFIPPPHVDPTRTPRRNHRHR